MDTSNYLVVILDTNPLEWGKRAYLNEQNKNNKQKPLITLSQCINHLLVFLKAFLLGSGNNKIVVIASHCDQSYFLYPTTNNSTFIKSEEQQDAPMIDASASKKTPDNLFLSESFEYIQNTILNQLKQLQYRISTKNTNQNNSSDLNSTPQQQQQPTSSLSGALSKTLCFLNRLDKDKAVGAKVFKRILVMNITNDIPVQYIAVMNSIFCAEKMKVTIDACNLSSDDSSFLQQAAYITKGVYMKPLYQEALIQYLMSVYLLDKPLREIIQTPIQTEVDFRATCFETRVAIDRGFVCSVCLSIFANLREVCSTCGSRFMVPTLTPTLAASALAAKKKMQTTTTTTTTTTVNTTNK